MGLFVLAPSGFAYLTEGGMHSREFYGRCFKIIRLNVEWFCFGSHAGGRTGGVLIVKLLVLDAIGRFCVHVSTF